MQCLSTMIVIRHKSTTFFKTIKIFFLIFLYHNIIGINRVLSKQTIHAPFFTYLDPRVLSV